MREYVAGHLIDKAVSFGSVDIGKDMFESVKVFGGRVHTEVSEFSDGIGKVGTSSQHQVYKAAYVTLILFDNLLVRVFDRFGVRHKFLERGEGSGGNFGRIMISTFKNGFRKLRLIQGQTLRFRVSVMLDVNAKEVRCITDNGDIEIFGDFGFETVC